ncbi:hypothetical protein BN7_5957 [Wickerhamomyces ciferrii]|uniref:Sec39 domain-containing protein n=1 Tax=Wickerhamomyces ciferrii (strain ATCC 14091 / BCRC 22168 / CBS 111 / JCM 3599 / NBRC 0793 / NRRL Y-1031 F-60-10) TaxID=1206466 RepID=K0KY32_WICCF|nr:uncharacterized protein BN7_5957 [Wickerhamomyces ciferrii]CCH46364.1 hypothetical protein BN7_5957 [Wickerhamomyces ciferrii]
MSENLDHQVIFAASILASKGSLHKLSKLLTNYNIETHILLQILLILIPELTPCDDIVNLFKSINDVEPIQNLDFIKEFISNEFELHDLLQLSNEILISRTTQLQKYLNEQSSKFGFSDDNYTNFVKARVRKILQIIPIIHSQDLLFNLVSQDENFQNWYNGIIIPYEYYLKISLDQNLSLQNFEKIDEISKISLIIKPIEISTKLIETPLISLIQNVKPESFLSYLETNQPKSFKSLKLILELITQILPIFEPKDQLINQTLNIIYNYEELSEISLNLINELILQIQEYSNDSNVLKLAKLSISAKTIKYYNNSLKSLDLVSNNHKSQLSLFQSILENQINPKTTKQEINQLFVLRQSIFTNLELQEYNKLIISKLLSLKLFNLLSSDNIEEDQIIDFFWKCFKKASNGSKNRGEILNASNALKIVNNPSSKIMNLQKLIDSIDEISKFSLYFHKNKPLVPGDLLKFQDSSIIIEKILELNPHAYLKFEKLYQISENLSQGLDMKRIDSFDLKILCIKNSLVNNDFSFAYESSIILFDQETTGDKLNDNWLIFFQVGKFFSPDWYDYEQGIPEEILKKQLNLLSKILKICPVKNSQIVIAQWSSLDMELSLR